MEANRPKNSYNWMQIIQFSVFCISCVAAVIIWYYTNMEKVNTAAENKYVSKYEIQFLERQVIENEKDIKEFRSEFSNKLEKMEQTNNDIIELITDIRLDMARGNNK